MTSRQRSLSAWKRRHNQRRHLIDALRRTTELLAGIHPENASEYWHEERDYIIAVNHRLLEQHDPKHVTDRAVR